MNEWNYMQALNTYIIFYREIIKIKALFLYLFWLLFRDCFVSIQRKGGEVLS